MIRHRVASLEQSEASALSPGAARPLQPLQEPRRGHAEEAERHHPREDLHGRLSLRAGQQAAIQDGLTERRAELDRSSHVRMAILESDDSGPNLNVLQPGFPTHAIGPPASVDPESGVKSDDLTA